MTDDNLCELTCEMCGDTYSVHPSRAPTSRFCSMDCLYRFNSEHSETFHSPSEDNEHEVLLERVREHYGHACIDCGSTHESRRDSIHVHHLVPSTRFDEGEGENPHFEENLVTLCCTCHNTWDTATRQLLDGKDVSNPDAAQAVAERICIEMGDDLSPLSEHAPGLVPVVQSRLLR